MVGTPATLPIAAWQPSLWANQSPRVDQSFARLERTALDRDSWVDHCPGWVAGSDQAFEDLLRDSAWSQRRRWMYDRQVDEPRLTSWQEFDERGVVERGWLEDARASLSAHYGVRFDSLGVNLYRDGTDSVAWHRDRIPSEIADPVVALVSLGEPRKFLLRPHGRRPVAGLQARSGGSPRYRWSDAASLRALRPEGEGGGRAIEPRVPTRRRLTWFSPSSGPS